MDAQRVPGRRHDEGRQRSTHIARQVRTLFDRLPEGERLTWHIADENPDVVVDILGVRTLYSHGHIAKGKGATAEQRTKGAMERQILARTSELQDLKLMFVAHYHHEYLITFEGRSLWRVPALEAGKKSEYMLDQ